MSSLMNQPYFWGKKYHQFRGRIQSGSRDYIMSPIFSVLSSTIVFIYDYHLAGNKRFVRSKDRRKILPQSFHNRCAVVSHVMCM